MVEDPVSCHINIMKACLVAIDHDAARREPKLVFTASAFPSAKTSHVSPGCHNQVIEISSCNREARIH